MTTFRLDDPDREPFTSAELEAARLAVSSHLGATPGWISALLAGKPVQIERWQGAYFLAWKARFGVAESVETAKTAKREAPRGRPATTTGGILPPETPPASKSEIGDSAEECGENATILIPIPESVEKSTLCREIDTFAGAGGSFGGGGASATWAPAPEGDFLPPAAPEPEPEPLELKPGGDDDAPPF
jgi:uncharacterized membrane protein YgcG